MPDTLLIIEDEALLGAELKRRYERLEWNVVWCKSLRDSRHALVDGEIEPLVVLSDMSLPDGNALDLLEEVREQRHIGEWIFLTGYGGVPDSVRALRLGAYDFLTKPAEHEQLDLVIAGAARSAGAQRRLQEEVSARAKRFPVETYGGRSGGARAVREMLVKLAQVPFTALLITGETGTGKGLAARILHHSGPRAAGPMVELNCAALPRELLESELFGHEAGAFTGARGRRRGLMEQADGGTLFLDEIGEMHPDLQPKLLKAIEDRTTRRIGGDKEIALDVQMVAATNQDLHEAVGSGRFRPDLYHRLGAFCLELPPLRERIEDLRDLVPQFVAEFNAKAHKDVRAIPDAAWEKLEAHAWPGNVRELRNVIERCVLFSTGQDFPVEWLQIGSSRAPGDSPGPENADGWLRLPLDGSMALDDMDRHIIESALNLHGNNVTATARALGTTRETLRYRIQKYGLHSSR